ncbi:MAG: hypothetical protein ABR541_00735 [Candidatus Dormibacteria bacterium]
MSENDASSNADIDEPGDFHDDSGSQGEAGRPTGGKKAADGGRVGMDPDKMRERGTLDPDRPDPSGGPT